ncbi:unnamed protein product [Lymnaea stagnalis]|uniref:Uncharacterized protein n=1 Tax=Lymnaea stagnalis TaxID=6523 RepID=A0AAV2HK90_LYMST
MEILHRIGTIFFLSTVLDFFAAQEITKFLKGQTQCSTKCKSGYLITSDTCVFNYEISFKEALPETSSLILEIREAHIEVFNPLITLNVMTDCTGFSKDADFYCTEIDSNVYIITINANELSRYSQAEIRAYTVIVNQKNVYSDILAFPQIFDPLNFNGHLKINGKNMSTDFCNTTIDVRDLTLEFDCVSAAKPCVIEMQVNGDTVVKQSENHAFFQGKYENGKDVLVTIKYSACRLDGKFITISCSVFTGLIQSTPKDNSNNDIAIGVTVPLACIFLVATISFLIYR